MFKLPDPPVIWSQQGLLKLPTGTPVGRIWKHGIIEGLSVIRSESTMQNEEEWIHVSVARRDKLPSWEDLAMIKEHFIGDFREAFHMIPKKEDHINFHVFCLHLWSPITETVELPNLLKLTMEKPL